jgi:hypothetical protein
MKSGALPSATGGLIGRKGRGPAGVTVRSNARDNQAFQQKV